MFSYILRACGALRFVVAGLIVISLWSCAGDKSQYLGQWHEKHVDMIITKTGNTFLVDSRNPRGFLTGKFVGKATDVGLSVNAGMLGEQLITYSKESDTLEFAGMTFQRVQKQ